MKTTVRAIIVLVVCGAASFALADTHYVAQNGQTPSGTYTNGWGSAASNIQAAVDQAVNGDTVLVNTGVYTRAYTPVVNITKSLTLQAAATNTAVIINGSSQAYQGINVGVPAAGQVVIDGFTVTNCGVSSINVYGAGICVTNAGAGTAVVQNCVIVGNKQGNTASGGGGGIAGLMLSGADFVVVVSNCDIVRNSSTCNGGGLYFQNGRFLVDTCRIVNNQVDAWNPFADPPVAAANSRSGGGLTTFYTAAGSVIRNCLIESNSASTWGGGVFIRYNGGVRLENCTIRRNISSTGSGVFIGGISSAQTNILRNCLISYNMATTNNLTNYDGTTPRGGGVRLGGAGLGVSSNVLIESCTVVSNSALYDGGGVFINSDSTNNTAVQNTILYYNKATTVPAGSNLTGTAYFTNCLVEIGTALTGSGNITNKAPGFVDVAGGNFRLASGSPCVNTGTNQDWMYGALDLDGKRRLDVHYSIVDRGCYEYVPVGTLFIIR